MLVRIFYSQNRYTLTLPFMLWGQEMHASAVNLIVKEELVLVWRQKSKGLHRKLT